MAIMSHSILDKEMLMNKVEKEVNRLKARLARWILKVVYRISTYDGSDSTHVSDDSSTIPEQEVKPETPEVQPEAQSESIKIDSFGSPNTSKATEDPNTQICDFKWSKDRLSYKWAKGNLRNWGIKNDHDASALAIFGYQDAKGTWRFGKIDWISTDRLTRDMANVHEGYNGIDSDAYFNSRHHGFFIMSSDGKRRTNILTD